MQSDVFFFYNGNNRRKRQGYERNEDAFQNKTITGRESPLETVLRKNHGSSDLRNPDRGGTLPDFSQEYPVRQPDGSSGILGRLMFADALSGASVFDDMGDNAWKGGVGAFCEEHGRKTAVFW